MRRIRKLVGLTPDLLDIVRRLQAANSVGGAVPSAEGILSEAVRIGLKVLAEGLKP